MMSAEQRGRGPINRACLIQPQPSRLPSSLCLREDTTAVTQTAVYPLLLAAARGIIHMLLCQESGKERQKKERERKKKKGEKRERCCLETNEKKDTHKTICVCKFTVQPNINVLLSVCFHHPLFSKQWRWKRFCATCRWLGGDAFQERVHMFLIILWLSQPTAAGETLEDWVCKSLRNMQKEKAKSSKFDIAHKWNQDIVPLFF